MPKGEYNDNLLKKNNINLYQKSYATWSSYCQRNYNTTFVYDQVE